MTTNTAENRPALLTALRKACRERAKANRQRDMIASAYLEGGYSGATLEIVAHATLRAVRAENAVRTARNAYLSTITA